MILGGGVIGLSCARAVARRRPSSTIVVVDEPTGALPASRAAAGMLAPFAEFAVDDPLARLAESSLAQWPEFLLTIGGETGIRIGASFAGTLLPDVPGETDRVAQRLAHAIARGVEPRVLEGEALRAAEPALSHGITRAVWLPEGVVNARALHDALAESARRMSVTLMTGRAIERIEAGSERLAGVRLDDGTDVMANVILVATGAWSRAMGTLFDVTIPVVPIKGQMARVAAPDGFLRHVVHRHDCYAAPRPGLGVIVGSTMEEKDFDTAVDPNVVAEFIHGADSMLPGLANFRIAETWAGLRPKATDGWPIIGRSARWSNLHLATGHFRNGILLTPATGEVVARQLDGEEVPEAAAFAPARLGI